MAPRRNAPKSTEMLDISTTTIHPADAKAFLNNNTQNYRNLRAMVVDRYATDMKDGNWQLTGAPIVFNGDGTLLDGQHRLTACVQADVPFTTVIVRGAPTESALAVDTGLKRSVADHLRRMGYTDAVALAALLRIAWQYDNNLILQAKGPTPHQLIAYVEDHPDVTEWMNPGKRLKTHLGITQTSASFALYATGRMGGDETQDALAFVDQTVEGVHLEQGSSIIALRKWANRAASSTHRPSTVHQAAIVMKALNAWREGVPVTLLAWKRGGLANEPFPSPWSG